MSPLRMLSREVGAWLPHQTGIIPAELQDADGTLCHQALLRGPRGQRWVRKSRPGETASLPGDPVKAQRLPAAGGSWSLGGRVLA